MPVDAAHVDLGKRAGQLLLFPGRGLFAGAQADDDVADPGRLTRFQLYLAAFAVALVEQSQHRDAFCHRRATGRQRGPLGRDGFDRRGIASIDGGQDLMRLRRLARGGRVERAKAEKPRNPEHHHQNAGGEPAPIHPSGVQAS
jgi:hypothetical protein